MMNFLISFIYLSTNIFAIYCVEIFYGCFLEPRKVAKWKKIIIYICVFLLFVCPNELLHNVVINLICSIFAFFLLTICYEGNPKYKLILTFFICLLGTLTELSITIVMKNRDEGIYQYRSVFYALSKLLYYVVIKIVELAFKRRKGGFTAAYYWWMVLAVPIGSIYIIHRTYCWFVDFSDGGRQLPVLNFIFILFIINILFFYFYDRLMQRYEESLEIERIRIQNQYYSNYIRVEQLNNEALRKWKHDMNNYFVGVIALMENHDYKTALGRLKKMVGNIELAENICYSGNAFIDSILYYKMNAARMDGIKVSYEFKIPKQINIQADDVSILIGNSFDNAIEACKGLPEADKNIYLKMDYKSGVIIYKIENKYITIWKEHGKFRTTKLSSPHNHGYGIKSIQTIAEKYHGNVVINTDNNTFTMTIMLFVPK